MQVDVSWHSSQSAVMTATKYSTWVSRARVALYEVIGTTLQSAVGKHNLRKAKQPRVHCRFHAGAGTGAQPPPKSWLGPQNLAGPQIVATPPNPAVLLTHRGQLILRKNSKSDSTRCLTLALRGTKFDFRWGLPQTPLGELAALPRPLAVYKGPTSKAREGKDEGGGPPPQIFWPRTAPARVRRGPKLSVPRRQCWVRRDFEAARGCTVQQTA